MKKNTNTAEYASRVKRGYLKKHKKQPTNNQLDKLTKKQIKQYYKAGSPKHTKLIHKVIIFTGIGIALFLGIATAVLASKYYSILRYQKLAQEIDRKAEAKSSDIVFKECYSKYKYVYYQGPNPKEYYESISKGYWECQEQANNKTEPVATEQPNASNTSNTQAQPTQNNPKSQPAAPQQNTTVPQQKPTFKIVASYLPSNGTIRQPFTIWAEANAPIVNCSFDVTGPEYHFGFEDGYGNRCSISRIYVTEPGLYSVKITAREVTNVLPRQEATTYLNIQIQ